MLLGRATLGGQPVEIVEIPRGSSRTIAQRSFEFGCQSLAARGEDQQPDGSWRTRWEERFVAFAPGEPDAKLFAAGTGYREIAVRGPRGCQP